MSFQITMVSFIVKCFNQARYIGAAMDGALAQTYRPIEYVIGDDASTDGSVAIILKKLADAGFVEDGPAKEEPTRTIRRFVKGDTVAWVAVNKRNLGNCGNWQALCELAHGELFVKADGDDVSLPTRTERVVAEWQQAGPKCGVIYHNAVKVDVDGKECGSVDKEVFERQLPLGAVMSCSRKCFSEFAAPILNAAADDIVYARRARYLGLSEHRFNESLVRYRVGSGVSTVGSSYCRSLYRSVVMADKSWQCSVADLEQLFEKSGCAALLTRELEFAKVSAESVGAELPMWESERFIERWRAFRKTHRRMCMDKVCMVHLVLLLGKFGRRLLDYFYRYH